ncbi:5' nucleotidase, NT5C type [Ectobacillus ponti]|uniref:Nucleotidase n=1 Tax=Ectobacillus ponti TaxID=2961894 RepID=A0AA42BRE4_9BACI|nr:HAD family acid phosphatase [Ectobacillus ponti]MCP8969399.1 hypothetical protein [Ectobacillus ponti]
MKLGFDIDDTLINLREHAFHLYNRKLNQNVGLDVFHGLKTLEIHEAFGLTKEEGGRMWRDSMEEVYFTDCPPFPYAVEVLRELEEQGHEIYYITARPKEHGERTKQWMKDNGFPVRDDRFYYGMKDEEKLQIIGQLGLDYYFDDKPRVLETLMDQQLKVYAKSNSYNQHLHIPRITCWSELKGILEG